MMMKTLFFALQNKRSFIITPHCLWSGRDEMHHPDISLAEVRMKQKESKANLGKGINHIEKNRSIKITI